MKSNKIKIEDLNIGCIEIEPYIEISKSQNAALKSLTFLMLMCIDGCDDEVTFTKFLNILTESTTKIQKLFPQQQDINNELNGTENF